MTLKVQCDLRVGVATHTGKVRTTNEDDYLVLLPGSQDRIARIGRVLVVADGMGGAVGGAEASRAAVRALAAGLVESGAAPAERMREGFARACREVYDLSRESPALRDMGTTLTALDLLGGRFVVGHVGDTRCLLLRGDELAQLTTDHAVRDTLQHLTRCIGAGRASEEVDVVQGMVEVGDVFALITDGVWSAVPEPEIVASLRHRDPQEAATELVRKANQGGGRDNATALVVVIDSVEPVTAAVDVELPAAEIDQASRLPPPARDLRAPRWPWLLLALSGVLGTLALLEAVYDIDVVTWVASGLRALWPR